MPDDAPEDWTSHATRDIDITVSANGARIEAVFGKAKAARALFVLFKEHEEAHREKRPIRPYGTVKLAQILDAKNSHEVTRLVEHLVKYGLAKDPHVGTGTRIEHRVEITPIGLQVVSALRHIESELFRANPDLFSDEEMHPKSRRQARQRGRDLESERRRQTERRE